ncbi:unnamed protein product, partial [Amoebophrya sp. A25]
LLTSVQNHRERNIWKREHKICAGIIRTFSGCCCSSIPTVSVIACLSLSERATPIYN